MGTTEVSVTGPGTGINSQIDFIRSRPVVLRNSRFLCWVTLSSSFFAAFMSIAMVLMVISLFFPAGELKGDQGWGAVGWGIAALALGFICPRLWNLGHAMAAYQVYLDGSGVTFNLGTKMAPSELFIAWNKIVAIKYKRAGNVQQCWVEGMDGCEATFSSYTFFRPKKVARMIAERAGVVIQKV